MYRSDVNKMIKELQEKARDLALVSGHNDGGSMNNLIDLIVSDTALAVRDKIVELIEIGGSSSTILSVHHNGERYINESQLVEAIKKEDK
jgi:hypothetical protein